MNDHDPSSSPDVSSGDHPGSDAETIDASRPQDSLEATFTRVAQHAAELLSVDGATVLCGVTFLGQDKPKPSSATTTQPA